MGSERAPASPGRTIAVTPRRGRREWVPVLACGVAVALLTGLAMGYAWQVPHGAGDDELWRAHAAGGLWKVWTEPSPFRHYRPVFGTWLFGLQRLGADSPTGLALGSLVLYLACAVATYWAFRPILGASAAVLTATLVCLHPARQQQLFWTSAGIDTLALVLSLVGLGLAVRAHRRDRVPPAIYIALALSSALAVLSKEIALILPLLVLLLSGSASRARRVALAAASGVGAAVAAGAGLAVVGGAGRAVDLLAVAGSPGVVLYPTRLVWPGDLPAWIREAKLGEGYAPLVTVATVSLGALVALARAWWGRLTSPVAWAGLILVCAGGLPWWVRSDDRAIGLGVVGVALLIAGAAIGRERRPTPIAVAAALLLVLSWCPLWTRWEERWLETTRLSALVDGSWRTWRSSAPPDALLVAIGGPSMVAWTCEVFGVGEIDPCALDLLTVVGPSPVLPVDVRVDEPGDRLSVTATGGSTFRWGREPAPGLGVTAIETDRAGYARGAVVDPHLLRAIASGRGCGGGVELRRWDGSAFVPLR